MLADELLRDALLSLREFNASTASPAIHARRRDAAGRIAEYLKEYKDLYPETEVNEVGVDRLYEMIRRSRVEHHHSMPDSGIWNLTRADYPSVVPAVVRFYSDDHALLTNENGRYGINATDEDLQKVIELSRIMTPAAFEDPNWSRTFYDIMERFWPRNWVRILATDVHPAFITYQRERQTR